MILTTRLRMNTGHNEMNDRMPGCNQPQIPGGAFCESSNAALSQSSGPRGDTDRSGYDPWMMYGGNIAAACQATNEAVSDAKQNEVDDDQEKQRQRASNRLTAWQSRERKRIEFEVMQERQAQLTKKNRELKHENEQIRGLIKRLKSVANTGGIRTGIIGPNTGGITGIPGAASHAAAIRAAAVANIKRTQQQPDRLIQAYQGMRRELPSLIHNNDFHNNLLLRGNVNFARDANTSSEGIVAPTVFAPLARQNLQLQQQQQLQLPFNVTNSPFSNLISTPYLRTMTKTPETRKTTSSPGVEPPAKKARNNKANSNPRTP